MKKLSLFGIMVSSLSSISVVDLLYPDWIVTAKVLILGHFKERLNFANTDVLGSWPIYVDLLLELD